MVKNISQLTAMWPSTVLFLSQHFEKIILLKNAYKTLHTNQYTKNGRVRFTDSLSNSSWKLQVFTKTTEHKTKQKNHKVAKIPHVLSSSFSNPTEIKINA